MGHPLSPSHHPHLHLFLSKKVECFYSVPKLKANLQKRWGHLWSRLSLNERVSIWREWFISQPFLNSRCEHSLHGSVRHSQYHTSSLPCKGQGAETKQFTQSQLPGGIVKPNWNPVVLFTESSPAPLWLPQQGFNRCFVETREKYMLSLEFAAKAETNLACC